MQVCEVLLQVQRKHASPAFEKIESFLHFMSDVGQTVPKRESVCTCRQKIVLVLTRAAQTAQL